MSKSNIVHFFFHPSDVGDNSDDFGDVFIYVSINDLTLNGFFYAGRKS